MKNQFENPQSYEDSARARSLMESADAIRQSLSPIPDGHIRLWRGNRPGEVGQNPSYTNSLEGIALPFLQGYGGVLSYVDVPEKDAEKYLRTGAVAEGAEFFLPAEIVRDAKIVGMTPEEAEEVKSKAKPKREETSGFGAPV